MKTKFNVGDIVYYLHGQKIIKDKVESFRTIDGKLIYKVKSNRWTFVEEEDDFNTKILFKNTKDLKIRKEENIREESENGFREYKI